MKVVYDGPQESRTVEIGRGKMVTAKRGTPVEVPKEVGESLLEQRHFSGAKTSKAKTSKAKTSKEGE